MFLTSLVTFYSTIVEAQTRTLVVPDQYPTIQGAVANASAGDTVFVKDGTYYVGEVRLTIDKPLSLVGQDKQATMIEFNGNSYYVNSAIDITSDNVILSGFTLRGNDVPTGIHLQGSNCKITDNIIENISFAAIAAEPSVNNKIDSNLITDNGYYGIYFPSSNSIISSNTLTDNNDTAIVIDSSENVTIVQNHIYDNGNGIYIRTYGNFDISGNNIAGNAGFGIKFGENCSNTIVHDNDLAYNQIGIDLMNFATITDLTHAERVDGYPLGTGNVVYQNDFIYNSINAKVEHSFPYDVGYVSNGTDVVSWDKGSIGNCWSDSYNPFAYVIGSNNVDHHPCLYLSILSIAIIVVLAALLALVIILLLYRRHRKKPMSQTNRPFTQ